MLLLFPCIYLCESDFFTLHVKKKSKPTVQAILNALFPQRSQELTIWSKTSHNSKIHTKVYLVVCLMLLMLKVNEIRCTVVNQCFLSE